MGEGGARSIVRLSLPTNSHFPVATVTDLEDDTTTEVGRAWSPTVSGRGGSDSMESLHSDDVASLHLTCYMFSKSPVPFYDTRVPDPCACMKIRCLNKIEDYAIVLLNSVRHARQSIATIVNATSEPTSRSGTP
jgi:hypothetical protein